MQRMQTDPIIDECQRSSKTDEFSTLVGLIGLGTVLRGS